MPSLKREPFRFQWSKIGKFLALAAIPVFLTACADRGTVQPGGINDPYEGFNRKIHERNKATDRAVIRPVSLAYAKHAPIGMQESIGAFRLNFATPGMVVNDILQLRAEDAFVNTLRFVMNTTLGLGGLVDVAGMHGLPARETDFGETLHFWQVSEGAYLELPVLGPSTQRDVAGKVGDFFLNPMRYAIPSPERYVGTGAAVLDRIGKRGRFAGTLDSVLYDSADSYAAARSAYLQNRRYQLGAGGAGVEDYEDPYGTGNAYEDPYLDPYAE